MHAEEAHTQFNLSLSHAQNHMGQIHHQQSNLENVAMATALLTYQPNTPQQDLQRISSKQFSF